MPVTAASGWDRAEPLLNKAGLTIDARLSVECQIMFLNPAAPFERNVAISPAFEYFIRFEGSHRDPEENVMSEKAADHHKKASEHLARAADHHRKAANHGERGRHETAVHHAQTARAHRLQAAGHAEKALNAHVEYIHLLMREADHRAKNMLGLVQAVARQTAAGEPESFIRSFSDRIQALAANHDLLVRNEWQGVAVADLIRTHLAHFADLIGVRIALRGPTNLRLNAAASEVIGLALHELATNAIKYNALSVDGGGIDVSWGVDGDMFMMSWIEHDGPPVSLPERTGFGSEVITSLPELTIGGEAQLEHAPSGTTWRLTCPAANALERSVNHRDGAIGKVKTRMSA